MTLANAVVSAVLRSPFHWVLSGSTDLIRFTGGRSGRTITTPTQYARPGDEVIVFVGRPETKTWWRNFTSAPDVEVLLKGRWYPMTAHAVIGAHEPDTIASLLDAYLRRFPRTARSLGSVSTAERCRKAVVVCCQPGTTGAPL